jgi:putative aldouronate transport system substrate-binding protein
MKGMKKARISMAAFMAIVLTSGCSTAVTPSKDSEKAVDNQPVELTWMTTGDMATKPLANDDRIVQEINKRLGIKLVVKAVPQGAFDKIYVAFAAGDIPDIVTTQYPSFPVASWIKEGLLVPINNYLPVMPTIKQKIEKNMQWTAVDGKYYGYPFLEERANSNLTYRADWLDKLGLKPPKTIDEFYAVLKAFTTGDPDGNGKSDTYGMSSRKELNDFNFIFYAYGLPYGDWALDGNNNVIPKHEHPAFKQGMTFIQKLWNEKLLEPELLLNDNQMLEQKFSQGKVGYMTAPLYRNLNRLEINLQKVNPAGKIGFVAPPTGAAGKKGNASTPKSGLITSITNKAKNPEKAAKFIEFMLSKEGRDLLELGIEGVHFTKKDGKIVYNEAERAKENFASDGWSHPLAWGSVVWPLTTMYLPDTEPQKDRAIESVKVATDNMMPNLINVTTPAEIEQGKVLGEIYTQAFTQMMTGKVSVEEGSADLNKKWRQQGGEQVLKELNTEYKNQKK